MERFVAMCVVFHQTRKRVQEFFPRISFGYLGYSMDRTHSILRIATSYCLFRQWCLPKCCSDDCFEQVSLPAAPIARAQGRSHNNEWLVSLSKKQISLGQCIG